MQLARQSDVAEPGAASSFRSRADLQAHYANSFTATVAEYVRIKQLSPIVASVYDPEGFGRSERLTFDLIGYICDIERATETALRDQPALQAVWFQLALNRPADPKLAHQCIQACGRVYSGRRLEPFRYYRRDRYPKRRTP
jgi:hypothetical protein